MSSQEETFRSVSLSVTTLLSTHQRTTRPTTTNNRDDTVPLSCNATRPPISPWAGCSRPPHCLYLREDAAASCSVLRLIGPTSTHGRLVPSLLDGRVRFVPTTCTHNISILHPDHRTPRTTHSCLQLCRWESNRQKLLISKTEHARIAKNKTFGRNSIENHLVFYCPVHHTPQNCDDDRGEIGPPSHNFLHASAHTSGSAGTHFLNGQPRASDPTSFWGKFLEAHEGGGLFTTHYNYFIIILWL